MTMAALDCSDRIADEVQSRQQGPDSTDLNGFGLPIARGGPVHWRWSLHGFELNGWIKQSICDQL